MIANYDSQIILYYFKFILSNKTNNCLNKTTLNQNTENDGFTCQLMNDSYKGDIIVCFEYINGGKIIQYFINPVDFSINSNHNKEINIGNTVKSLKSSSTINKKNSLICFNLENSTCLYTFYSIETHSYNNLEPFEFNCSQDINSMDVYYMRETDNFLFVSSNDNNEGNNNMFMAIFDKNLEKKIAI